MNLGKNALKMDTTQSMVITFFDVFIVMFIVILGIIRSPFKFSVYRNFLTLLKEVSIKRVIYLTISCILISSDLYKCFNFKIGSIIHTTDSEKTRRNHFLGLSMILLFVISLLIFTICVEETTKGAKNYIAFYFMYMIVFVFECQYWQSVQSIERRFKRLNECFNFDDILKFDENNLIIRSKKTFTNTFSITYNRSISEVIERNQNPIYANELKGKKIIDIISMMGGKDIHIQNPIYIYYVHNDIIILVNKINNTYFRKCRYATTIAQRIYR